MMISFLIENSIMHVVIITLSMLLLLQQAHHIVYDLKIHVLFINLLYNWNFLQAFNDSAKITPFKQISI